VRIRVVAIGSRMPGWVREAVDDYLRRFASQLRVSIIEIEGG
jgi:23S rRNA (pseudouridine1915-N3)-methyltransferase